MTAPEPPRTDPAVIQAWRDRQNRGAPKAGTKADSLAAQQKMVDLLNNPQRLFGRLSRAAAAGSKAMVVLDKPYKGLTSLPATAIDGCETPGKVSLLKDAEGNWYAIGKGKEKIRRDRHIERSGEDDPVGVMGEIAYCYSIFIQRRTAIDQPYKWFWQVFIGGWQAENILVKEWEVPESANDPGKPRNLPAPQAIVDFRDGTFYVSLQYTLFLGSPYDTDTSAFLERRYALFKGTKKEDVEPPKWDKTTNEMLPAVNSLDLSPRGFGYWSSQNNGATNYSLYDGAIATHTYTFVSNDDRTTLIPQGWQKAPKAAKYAVTETYVPVESSGQSIVLPLSTGITFHGPVGVADEYGNFYYSSAVPDRYGTFPLSSTGAALDTTYNRTQEVFALYRLSEDGENLLSGSKQIVDSSYYSSHSQSNYTYTATTADLTGQMTSSNSGVGGTGSYASGTLYGYATTYVNRGVYGGGSSSTTAIKLQEDPIYSTEKTGSNITTFSQGTGGNSSNTVTSDPPEIIKLDMPEDGGSIPFMAKLADVGNAFTTVPAKPAIATGSVMASLLSLSSGAIAGAGSPYLTDVHDKFISAIQCPELLNRGTVESQNIYGDLSPIYPLVANASALSNLAGMNDEKSYGVTSTSKVYTFNLASTAAPNGTTVLNAYGGYGRWIESGTLPTNPPSPDDKKLPGVMKLVDYFPEMQDTPPVPEWIGYKNIEHENRTVNVFLWDSGLSGPYKPASVEVDVQKIDAVAKVIADNTLQKLLSYTFFNASFG